MAIQEAQVAAPFNGGDHPEPDEEEVTVPENSTVARLRARREELRAERHIDIEVPGYNGDLVVRYRPVGVGRPAGDRGTVDEVEEPPQ